MFKLCKECSGSCCTYCHLKYHRYKLKHDLGYARWYKALGTKNQYDDSRTVVLVNGCFDVLHVGHKRHLEAAKALADEVKLVVSLTLDKYVNKGPNRPIHSWAHRAELLLALRCVDEVIPSRTAVDAILKVRPDIFVKGIDYKDSPLLDQTIDACKKVGTKIHITKTKKLSSTAIYDRLRQSKRF